MRRDANVCLLRRFVLGLFAATSVIFRPPDIRPDCKLATFPLKNCRQFYRFYPICKSLSGEFAATPSWSEMSPFGIYDLPVIDTSLRTRNSDKLSNSLAHLARLE